MKILYLTILVLFLSVGTVFGFGGSMGGPVAASTVLEDSFTESSITLLTNHTPDLGAAWELLSGSEANVTAGTGILYFSGGGTSFYESGEDIQDGVITAFVKNHQGNANYISGVTHRMSMDTGVAGYTLKFKGDGAVQVTETNSSGSFQGNRIDTTIASYDYTAWYKVVFTADGDDFDLKIYDDTGTEVLSESFTDTSLPSGTVGIYFYNNGYFDSYVVEGL